MPPAFLQVWTRFDAGGSVETLWRLDPLFVDPYPHTFTLEGQIAGVASGTDFTAIGSPAENVDRLSESVDRHLGMYQDFAYRVKLVTSVGTYYSRVVHRPDPLSFRDWRIARDIVRKEKLRHQLYTSLRGFLLRRRRGGYRCPRCTEEVDTGPTDDRCLRCYGTGYDTGYFPPMPADMQLEVHGVIGQVDPSKERGAVEDRNIPGARMLGDPYPYAQDIFVDGRTNLRYVIERVQESAIVRDYPLITVVVAKVANQGDIVYDIAIPAMTSIDRDELNPRTL